MDTNTISELSQINQTLIIIAVLLAILVIMHFVNVVGNGINNWRSYRNRLINKRSSEMHDRADYEALETYLNETLERFPNNPHAVFWMARCQLDSSNLESAKELFNRLKTLEPSWEDQCVTPFLKEIDEKH